MLIDEAGERRGGSLGERGVKVWWRVIATLLFVAVVSLGTGATAQDEDTSFSLPDVTSATTSASELDILTVPMTASDLSGLAEVWQGHLRDRLEEIAELNLELVDAQPFVHQMLVLGHASA